MQRNLEASGGSFYSQALLLALVDSGLSRDEAYRLVQELSFRAREAGTGFPELARQDPTVRARLDRRALGQVFSLKRLLKHVNAVYRRVGLSLRKV
jgi:adenylosuccinate lyase